MAVGYSRTCLSGGTFLRHLTGVERIYTALSPHDAYKLANAHEAQEDPYWADKKLGIMEEIIRAKVSQHYYVQQQLLESGDSKIIEDSPKDSFWGWGPDRQGRNELGKIWMKLRNELRLGEIALLAEPSYET